MVTIRTIRTLLGMPPVVTHYDSVFLYFSHHGTEMQEEIQTSVLSYCYCFLSEMGGMAFLIRQCKLSKKTDYIVTCLVCKSPGTQFFNSIYTVL